MRTPHALVGLFILGSAAWAVSQPRIYRNRDFGFVLPIPAGVMPCIPPNYRGNGIDHGPQIILAPIDRSYCSKDAGKRYIDVVAAYALDDWKTVPAFLQSLCNDYPRDKNDPKAACSTAPPELGFTGLPSEAARINYSNGLIEIIVVTLAGKPDPSFDPTVPSRNYQMVLTTDAQHLDNDLKVLRTILKTIRISPD